MRERVRFNFYVFYVFGRWIHDNRNIIIGIKNSVRAPVVIVEVISCVVNIPRSYLCNVKKKKVIKLV